MHEGGTDTTSSQVNIICIRFKGMCMALVEVGSMRLGYTLA